MDKMEGQILVEALIGLALLSLGAGLGAFLILGGTRVFSDRLHTFRAHSFTEEGVQAATSLILENWADVGDGTYGLLRVGGVWQFSGSSDARQDLTREVTVATLDSYRKEIRVRVDWRAASDRVLHVEIPTLVARWEDALQTGGGPGSGEGSGLSGNWLHPKTVGEEDVSPSGRKGTDVALSGTLAYLSTTRTGSSDSFSVFQVSNPNSPLELGGFNTGGDLNSLVVSSSYAYVVSVANDKEFLVLDVSNPASISEVSSLNLPGTEDALTVFLSGTTAYVGRSAGESIKEFVAIDVSTPSSPAVLGSMEIGADVNDVYVLGQSAYLATRVSGRELIVLDVSNPSSFAVLGSFDVGGESDAGEGRSVYAQTPTRVFLGTNRTLYALNAASSSISLHGTFSVNGSVNDIVMVGEYGFLAASVSNAELYVLDISNPAQISEISRFNYPQDGVGVDYEDNYVYVAVRSNDVLRIIGSGE